MNITIKEAWNKDIKLLNKLNSEVQNIHNKLFPNIFKSHIKSNMSDIFKNVINDK